jgi:uncharacterized membrane protein YkoI
LIMFSTTRHFYPNGIEGEGMDCTFKSFDSIEKAINYARRYAKGLRFAGVQIEDESGNTVYEITSDFEVVDNRTKGDN